jgi:DNA polymerase III delta prime subunit
MLKFQSIIVITSNPRKDLLSHFKIDLDLQHIDISLYRPDPSIGIDLIKDIISASKHRPLIYNTKTIILLEAEKMTIEAQNALLKLLEEPPSYISIILTSEYPQSLTETIQSRCQIIRFPTITRKKNTDDELHSLCNLAAPVRLSKLPSTKTKKAAIEYCQKLITNAESLLIENPSAVTLNNVNVINYCINALNQNANPTISIGDMVLRLHGSS